MRLRVIFIGIMMIAFPGCSLLIGNVKPVEEKSESYQVVDLSKENHDWVKLEPSTTTRKPEAEDEGNTEISDITFQSRKTASIISLNSACRATAKNQTLQEITRELLLGFGDISQRTEKETVVSGSPSLETTLKGKLNGEAMMLRTVVVRRGGCVYDLMYIARPEHFESQLNDFSRFTGSLKLK